MGLKLSRMTSRLPIIMPLLVLLSGMFITRSCDDDGGQQNAVREEERFFDIYVAANYPEAVLQPSGIYFLENKEGSGQMPGDTSWLWIEHVAYTIPEEQVFETYLESVALDNRIHDTVALYGPYKVQNGTINEGFTAGLKLMQEGGEATIMFTSDLGFGTNTSGVGAYQSLKYEIRLLEVMDDILAYESEKILTYIDTIDGVQAVLDTITDVTMYYVIDESTDGPPVAPDSTIEVAYKGYLIDGRVFDESAGDSGLKFKVDDEEGGVITGWNLGLQSFKEGEKGRLIIPYELAYGEFGQYTDRGNVAIPPYETLVFDVEVLSVDAADDNEIPKDIE